jgi:hypothetical protein
MATGNSGYKNGYVTPSIEIDGDAVIPTRFDPGLDWTLFAENGAAPGLFPVIETSDALKPAIGISWGLSPDMSWDANDIAAADGAKFATWASANGAIDLVQATVGNQMTYRANAASNGLPSAEGGLVASTHMDAAGMADMLQPNTFIVVLDNKTIGGWHVYFDGTINRNVLGENLTGNTFFVSDGTAGPTNVGLVKLGTQFIAVRFDGASSKVDHDGSAYTGLAVGVNKLNVLRVGASNGGVDAADSYFHEIQAFDRLLTDQEIAGIRSSMQAKWGTP